MVAEAEGTSAGAFALKQAIVYFETSPSASAFVDLDGGRSGCPMLCQDGGQPWDLGHDTAEAVRAIAIAEGVADVLADTNCKAGQ